MTLRLRARKVAPVPGYKPWAAVTLSVDGGEHCGVALYQAGVYYDSGAGDGYDAAWIRSWITNAAFLAKQLELPLVLVVERPPAGGAGYRGTSRSIAGGASVMGCNKLWTREWEKHKGTVSRYRVQVYPPTWRSAVLGTVKHPQPREKLRAAVEKFSDANKAEALGQDESAAICIGIWSSNAPQVGKVLPDKLRRCAS